MFDPSVSTTTPVPSQDPFQRFDQIVCHPADAAYYGVAPGPLTLHRLWPQRADQISLEYLDTQGQIVAGQWLGNPQQFAQIVQGTAKAAKQIPHAQPWPLPERQILLQPHGVDRQLPGLAQLLATPQSRLLVHRPERRAVVRLQEQEKVRYAKVVRPERAAGLATIMDGIQQLAAGAFQTPTVEAVVETEGILYLTALPGQSLYDRLGAADLPRWAASAGQILRQLHRLPAPAHAQPHRAAHEIQVLDKWLQQLAWLMPSAPDALRPVYRQICTALQADSSPPVLLHRDFYDKQVFITEDGATGLLDFDLMAVGEAALDVANALVHFELRAFQALADPLVAIKASEVFLAAYQPTAAVNQRLQAYADATRLRLACVYGCRPYGATVVPQLLARIGSPIGCELAV